MDLNLDDNQIEVINDGIASCVKLKCLSLNNNKLKSKVSGGKTQCLPPALFTSTDLVDLSLKGNQIVKRELMEFDGIESFVDRRVKIKNKEIGSLGDWGFCGLD